MRYLETAKRGLAAALIAAMTLLFVLAIRELGSSLFLYSSDTMVMAVLLLDYYEGGSVGKTSAFSLVQIALLAVLISSIALLMVLREMGVDIVPMLTGAGIGGCGHSTASAQLPRKLVTRTRRSGTRSGAASERHTHFPWRPHMPYRTMGWIHANLARLARGPAPLAGGHRLPRAHAARVRAA